MRVEEHKPTSPPRLNCVRMNRSESVQLLNAILEIRHQLAEEGLALTIRRKPLLKSNSTLRARRPPTLPSEFGL